MHLPKNFRLIKCDFSLELEREGFLPSFLGSTIRGGFGSVFKRIVCIAKGTDCRDCILKDKCVYSYIFESPGEDARYTYIPHPFVIEPPFFVEKAVRSFHFNLILFGNAIEYLPYFIYTFEELGNTGLGRQRIKYRIKEITSKEMSVYDGKTKVLQNPPVPITGKGIEKRVSSYKGSIKRFTLEFITPARIKQSGRFTDKLDFAILFKNLVRRVAVLSRYHCKEEWDFDITVTYDVRTTESNLFWIDIERYSSRQKARMKMGGVMGEITLEGDLTPLLPLFKLGEYTHIGKATAFGLGKYEIKLDKQGFL